MVFILSEAPLRPREPRQYHLLDPSQSLRQLLRRRSFVEFPTIEVMSRFDYETVVASLTAGGLTAALPIDINTENTSYDESSSNGSDDATRHRRERRRLGRVEGTHLLS